MRFKFLWSGRICFWLLIFVICLLLGGCRSTSNPKEADLLHIQSTNNTFNGKKKVIFVLVDSLMDQLIQRGIEHNELPAFQYLIQHGQYYPDMISSFPTMSISIDSTLLTGRYPDAHHVPGLTWYPHQGQKVIGYGSAPVEILRRGTKSVLTHALKDLNNQHLNPDVPTKYEDLKQLGFTSGSVNGLVYRGMTSHQIDLPQPLRELVPLDLPFQVKGPDFLAFGALSNPLDGVTNLPDGPADRMGFNDRYAIGVAKYLIQTGQLPDFLLIYLPDLDGKLHKRGLTDREGIKERNRRLKELLDAYESRAHALHDTILIVAGDSGMSQVLPKEQQPVIDLPKLLQRYHVLPTGQTMNSSTEIALAVNDTMAYVYSLKPENSLKEIADVLRNDPRIDLISWQEDGWIHCVNAGDPTSMRFKAGGDWIDPYHQSWTVQGTEQILDLKRESTSRRNKSRHITYGKYPDPLRRLQGALQSHEGRFLIVTAKPGYELAEAGAPTHSGGGAHGGLDASASLVPLIIYGTEKRPEFLRIVDLKAYLLDLLKSESRK
ncbi:Predicted pyrophosphatase or phosphodiesterase, AlkP superfamily [Paenibacillus barengoltzii]|nr:Predicted pyrophosphatase or phosphodiesterase, AlkP superfamily [Paenibacillus barengoltzii]